ncbi:chemotaxis protein [Paenibacillus antri]|uniref:Chemotaxis protein n=1 Tax=Paenibacillus antri TaxID=2582848 RepID=A0A5R9FY75_9BACL|nr:methyl-accepting chemotaxis protein [Paenibacillus antri]TLS48441.1 chemotaxis protein [Paenibacillus antri]
MINFSAFRKPAAATGTTAAVPKRDERLSLQEKDMVRRNGVVFVAMSVITALTVFAVLAMGGSTLTLESLGVAIIMALHLAAFAALHLKRVWIMKLKYVAVIGSALSSLYTIVSSPDATNVFSVYYLLVLTLIYMSMPLMIAIETYSFGLLIFLLFVQDTGIAPDKASTYLIYFVLISILLFSLLRVSNHLMKDTERSRSDAEELLEQQRRQKEGVIAVVGEVSRSLTALNLSGAETNQSFGEMNVAFQEITVGASAQMESTLSINESIQTMSERIDSMSDAMRSLREEARSAKGLSDDGETQVRELTDTFVRFRGEIESMQSEIASLIERVNEASQFSLTIKEIANQTNLLSLNASIEAARAGEHGKGFSVVASEIRKLADMASRSADQITGVLSSFAAQSDQTRRRMGHVAEQMERSQETTDRTRQAFEQISAAVDALELLSESSARLTSEIQASAGSVGESTAQLASVSQQTSASLEQLTATLETLLVGNRTSLTNLKQVEESLHRIS